MRIDYIAESESIEACFNASSDVQVSIARWKSSDKESFDFNLKEINFPIAKHKKAFPIARLLKLIFQRFIIGNEAE